MNSDAYTPLGVVFDVVLILIGLAITIDLRGVPWRIHSIMRIAWNRMGKNGGLDRFVRIYLFLGPLPFWVTRSFFLLVLVCGGVVAVISGPH